MYFNYKTRYFIQAGCKYLFNSVDDYNNNRYKEFKNYVTSYDSYIDVLSSPKDPREAGKIDAKYIEIILDKAVFNYDLCCSLQKSAAVSCSVGCCWG